MSAERSSSAVRDLRSIFENKAVEESNKARGRSPGDLSVEGDLKRPHSKIRASFVHVGPKMATPTTEAENPLSIPENTAVDSATSSDVNGTSTTPAAKEKGNGKKKTKSSEVKLGKSTPVNESKPPQNPDKPVTGAEEEPAAITPADPTNEAAVSGGQGTGATEDLRKPRLEGSLYRGTAASAARASKPAAISTKDTAKAPTSSIKSPASQSSRQSLAGVKPLAKKASRSSLTAPTAASVARAAAAAEKSKEPVPTSKPKAREPTKVVGVSSHLTAPTAASRARTEAPTSTPSSPSSVKTTLPSRVKPAATTTSRSTPRASLAVRPGSGDAKPPSATRKPAGPVDGSFLDRMTRPTAASSSRGAHDKPSEMPPITNILKKNPALKSATPAAAKPKLNGAEKTPTKEVASEEPAVGAEDSLAVEQSAATTTAAEEPTAVESKENAIPAEPAQFSGETIEEPAAIAKEEPVKPADVPEPKSEPEPEHIETSAPTPAEESNAIPTESAQFSGETIEPAAAEEPAAVEEPAAAAEDKQDATEEAVSGVTADATSSDPFGSVKEDEKEKKTEEKEEKKDAETAAEEEL